MNQYKKIEKLENVIYQLTEERNSMKYNFINFQEKQKLVDEKYNEYCKLVLELSKLKSQYQDLISKLQMAIKQQPKTYKKFNKQLKNIK